MRQRVRMRREEVEVQDVCVEMAAIADKDGVKSKEKLV